MAPKPSVLIVGDDTGDRGELYDLLKARGYAPVAVSTCEQALSHVRKSPPAAALVYLLLSDLPGHVVIHGILQASPQTECIALVTSPTQQQAAHEAVRSGAFAFLRRDYDYEQLLAILKRAVEKHDSTQSLRDVKERLAILFDSLPAGVLIVDARTRAVVDANPEAVRIIALPKEEIVGSLCHSRPRLRTREGDVETGEVDSSVGCVIPATRTVAEITLGGRKHFVEGFVDVSGKLRIEDKMHEHETINMLLMDHVRDVVMTVGPDRKITSIASMTKDDNRERIGTDSLALIPSSCRERYRRGLERVFQEGESEAFSQGSPPLESWSIRMEPVVSRGEVIAAGVRVRDLNARERTLEKLEFRGAAMEKSSEAILTLNADGQIVDANMAACDLLEYLPGEIIGTSFSRLEAHADTRWDDRWRKLSLEERETHEILLRTRGDRTISVKMDAHFAIIEGTPMCFTFLEDLSSQRDLDEAVHSIESKENAFLAAIRDAAVMIDREGRITNLNREASRRFNSSVDSVIDSNYYRLLPEAVARFRKGRIDEVFVRDREIRFEDRLGHEILDNTVCPVRDSENLITQVLVVSRDITAHRAQWARIEGLWNSGNASLFEFDFSKVRRDISSISGQDSPESYLRKQTDLVRSCISKIGVRDVNPVALELLGLTGVEEVRDHVEGLFTPSGALQMIGGLVALYSAGAVVDFEQQFRTADGGTADGMLRLIVNHGPADEWHHVLGVLIDVSALRETREQLVEASLGERVRLTQEISGSIGETVKAATDLSAKLDKGLAQTKSPYAEHAKTLQAQLAKMQEQLELLVSDTRSEASAGETLIASLRRLGDHTQHRYGVECSCNLSAVGLVRDRDLSGHLFHIAREAVDYAMRRHQPSEISITVKAANRGGVLAIRDNGNGVGEVDLRDVSSVLMQTHAILIDAELECARSPQGGNEQTCVFRIPGS